MTKQFVVNQNVSKTRIDVYIQQHCIPKSIELSRSRLQKFIHEGNIRVNGKSVKTSYKLKRNDIIEIDDIVFIKQSNEDVGKMKTMVEDNNVVIDQKIEPENIPLTIIYEDDDIAIINKPRGMVVHPAPGHGSSGTLVNALLYKYGNNLSRLTTIRPGIIHRIDKFTSGLLVIAKNDKVHDLLQSQLEDHSITRKYVCLVFNDMKKDRDTIDEPICRHPTHPNKRVIGDKMDKNAKRAVTHYQVLKRFKYKYHKQWIHLTLLECTLETGRTHQIRVHLSYIGRSIVGDLTYGTKKQPFELEGPALHAKVLGFKHPTTQKYMEFEADIPEYFTNLLNKLQVVEDL